MVNEKTLFLVYGLTAARPLAKIEFLLIFGTQNIYNEMSERSQRYDMAIYIVKNGPKIQR